MSFLAHLETWIREHRPGWATTRSEDDATLRIREASAPEDARGRHATIEVHEDGESLLLDWAWKLPGQEERSREILDLVVAYVDETFENHGWEVPVLLQGGPLHGRHLTKPRDDLVGRLLFARKTGGAEADHQADLYKWRLKRSEKGEYLCVYERTLRGSELDRFIARGVESTGPFVLIHDGNDA